MWQNIKRFIKRYWVSTVFAGLLGLGAQGIATHEQNIKTQKIKAKTAKLRQDSLKAVQKQKIKSPLLAIKYQTDTLDKSGTALYIYFAGKITRYFVEKDNRYELQLPYLAHEEWHRHNHESYFRLKYYYTPIDYYRLCMHNEISANMAALLTARYEYLAAPNRAEKQKILNRYKNTYMKFYFGAIAKGKIKPESQKPSDIEAERRLIANGTLNMWLDQFARHYRPSFYYMLQQYVDRMGLISKNNKAYKKVLNHMYTIGGVNFAEYFKKDIELREDKVLLAEYLPKIKFMKSGGVEIMNIVNNNSHLMECVGIDQQPEILQNLLISSQLKYMLRHKTPEEIQANPQLVNLCYRKVMNKVYTDHTFIETVKSFPLFSLNRSNLMIKNTNFENTAQQMYEFKGIDLTSMIAEFSPHNVPVKSSFSKKFDYGNSDGLSYLFPKLTDAAEKTLLKPDTPQNTSHTVGGVQRKAPHRQRLSEIMVINLPNLREPILLHNSKEADEQIFAALREFEAIPQVFKNCDTSAQQKYLQEHQEYVDTLKNFQATGSINIKPFIKKQERQK